MKLTPIPDDLPEFKEMGEVLLLAWERLEEYTPDQQARLLRGVELFRRMGLIEEVGR